jgi:uncharacterized surface protein with fasciclin (FAS1) repeats
MIMTAFIRMALVLTISMIVTNAFCQTIGIADVVKESKDHSVLVTKIYDGGLLQNVIGNGPYTFFAPVNSAFDNLSPGFIDSIMQPQYYQSRRAILNYQVVSEKIDLETLKKGKENFTRSYKTLSGEELKLTLMNGNVIVENNRGDQAKVIATGVAASNGIVYFTDKVLFPK